MKNYRQKLLPFETYHLFSRAIGKEKIFLEKGNYYFFLEKLNYHTHAVSEVMCYALLPNHFHLVIKVRSSNKIVTYYEKIKKKIYNPNNCDLSDFIMERFSNFLNCYTKSFNKVYKRKGGLFIDYMKRNKVDKSGDLTSFIFYTHKNPVHHGYAKAIGDWEFDSYQILISNEPTLLPRKEILNWFGGKKAFIRFHQQPVKVRRPDL